MLVPDDERCTDCFYICIMFNSRQGGFSQMPTIVKNIIIINVLFFLAQNVLGEKGDMYLALHYWGSPHFRWWQLFTHMFMHANFAHIFFNMFALWMFGSILENVFGPKRFLMFYLITGVGAALCHLSVLGYEFYQINTAFVHYQENPTIAGYTQFLKETAFSEDVFSRIRTFWLQNPGCADCAQQSIQLIQQKYTALVNEPTVGASGAVFGLLFAFGYLFPEMDFPPMPIKAKWFVAIYAAIELFSGIQNSAGDNIAHFAHLGGMLFAFIMLRIWNTRRMRW